MKKRQEKGLPQQQSVGIFETLKLNDIKATRLNNISGKCNIKEGNSTYLQSCMISLNLLFSLRSLRPIAHKHEMAQEASKY